MADVITHQSLMKTIANLQHQIRSIRVQKALSCFANKLDIHVSLEQRLEKELAKRLQDAFAIDEILDEYEARFN